MSGTTDPEPAAGRLARLGQGFRRHVLRNALIVAAAGAAVTTVVTGGRILTGQFLGPEGTKLVDSEGR